MDSWLNTIMMLMTPTQNNHKFAYYFCTGRFKVMRTKYYKPLTKMFCC